MILMMDFLLASPFEINSIIRMSDVVIAGGHALLNYALPMNPRSFLVPDIGGCIQIRSTLGRK